LNHRFNSPIRHGDTLFVGGYNGLYVLNPADGTLQWRFQANGYAAQLGAPTIVGGVAYFGTCGPPSGVYAVSMDK
jgi:outer membrane protein assembly factor BamB